MTKKIIYLLLVVQISLIAQANYVMKLTNPNQINSKSLEFDIIIGSTDTNFTISSYQCSFSFNLNLQQNDSISMSYIENSSELANIPFNILGFITSDGVNELVFASGIGNDIITQDEKLLGRFNITSTLDFNFEDLNLIWDFSGSINTIIADANFSDITVPNNHLNFDNTVTDTEYLENSPKSFKLGQNYPNPFNPTTKINFDIPNSGIVKISVFNVIGEKLFDLVEKTFEKGNHTIVFNGSRLASGIYFYRMELDGKVSVTRKMNLIK